MTGDAILVLQICGTETRLDAMPNAAQSTSSQANTSNETLDSNATFTWGPLRMCAARRSEQAQERWLSECVLLVGNERACTQCREGSV